MTQNDYEWNESFYTLLIGTETITIHEGSKGIFITFKWITSSQAF